MPLFLLPCSLLQPSLCFTSKLRPLVLCQHLVWGGAEPPTIPQRSLPSCGSTSSSPGTCLHRLHPRAAPAHKGVLALSLAPVHSRSRQTGEAPASLDAQRFLLPFPSSPPPPA